MFTVRGFLSVAMMTIFRRLFTVLLFVPISAAVAAEPPSLWAKDNLVAWCIVPFDAKKRGPEERAVMLEKLGIHRLAYDYRAEHIPTFDTEIETMQRHQIEFTAWWFPGELNAEAQLILKTIEKHKITPQLWVTGGGEMLPAGKKQAERVAAEATRIKAIAVEAKRLGCKVALYNHGAWFGEPENQIEMIEALRREGIDNVGIVYNFHHGHEHLPRFGAMLEKMKPYLLAVNLNGMIPGGDKAGKKILNLAEGSQELEMMRAIEASGWRGAVGIIDHRETTDSEETLGDNLKGLAWLTAELGATGSGGPRPFSEAKVGEGTVTPFFPTASPLEPALHPYAKHPINRDRIYDFYAKQAVRFAEQRPLPELLPSFPGLDGGRYGHWGNQNDEIWRDSRWDEMDIGGVLCGITKLGARRIPRGVCLQLGARRELAACFDTERLSWEGVWEGGGLVHFDSIRWGMLSELLPTGPVSPTPLAQPSTKRDIAYHGYYRHGAKVVFSYAQEGEEWLESAWTEGGKFVVQREKRGGALEAMTKGGPPQWPQVLESKGTLGQQRPYSIDTITLPKTPWKSLWHIGGHDFLPNGDAALCTFEGEVWVVSGLDDSLTNVHWRRFAAGLSQPLGLKVIDGKICVLGRDQITRLHDLNADSEADFYEAYSRAYETPIGGHDYLTGLEVDAQGRFYFAGGKMGVARIASDRQKLEVLATGFRNPNGIAVGPKGEIIAAVQEGDWTAASWLTEVTPGGHYRYGGPKPGPLGDLSPTLYFPRGVDNSCGGHVFIDSSKWGLPAGELLHFSWGTGSAFLILREEINGQKQGCAVPLPGEFRSGADRGRFRPQDGQLYVSGITGWGTYTPEDGCFERMRYTGGAVIAPAAIHTHENGLRIAFAEPLSESDLKAAPIFAQQWNYRIGPAYGSDEYSVRWPETPGHDVLEIKSTHLLDGGRTLFIEIPQLQPSHQLHLYIGVKALLSRDFFLTPHRTGPPFTGFPGYSAIAKQMPHNHAHPTTAAAPVPVKWEQGQPGRALKIQTTAGMQFAQKELTAKAGERLSLTLENPDVMPHNWALLQPGSTERVGQLANLLIAAPDAATRHYIPDSPDVLTHTRVLDPQKATTIHFTAPAKPGRYPYVCTFPGHWMLMRGELIVK